VAETLSRSVKRGAAWVIVSRITLQGLNLSTSIVLARLLTPTDFGLMGIVGLFTELATVLFQFGFGMALIQRETIRKEHVSAMFLMTLGMNALIWIGLVVASPSVGRYFNNKLVGTVLSVMALNFLIRAIGVCPASLLRRAMNFKVLTYGLVIDASTNLAVSITLASQGFGVWSLAYGGLAGGLAEKVYLFWAARWWPSMRTDRQAVRDLFRYGMNISFKSTLIYLFENSDNWIVGKNLGPAALGFYERSYNLMNKPVRELSGQFSSVLFPAFSRIQTDRDRLRAAFQKTLLSLSLVGYPVFAGLIVLAPEVIRVLLGAQWIPSIVPFQILGIAGVPRIVTQVTSSIINATGTVAPEVKRRGIVLGLLVAGAFLGSHWGIVGVATAVAIVNFLAGAMIWVLLTRLSAITLADLWAAQRLSLLASVALVAVALGTRAALGAMGHAEPALVLVVAGPLGALVYVAVLFAFRDPPLVALMGEFRRDVAPLLARFRPRRPNANDA
jgi:PST family polysaccharide transporter